MPTPRTDVRWVEMVKQLKADDASRTAAKIQGDLFMEWANHPDDLPKTNPPGERTIGRILTDYARATEADRIPYERVYWPETFARGAAGLPWEASPVVLKLIALMEPKRPTVRLARWYWRVSQAAPGTLDDYELKGAASNLADAEARGEAPSRGVETSLVNSIWDSWEHGPEKGSHAPRPRSGPPPEQSATRPKKEERRE